MKPLSRLLVALCLSPLLVQAAPLTQVTLPDGRQVQLNDDFTWEYLLLKPAADGGAVQGSVAVPVLTEQAMSNPSCWLRPSGRDRRQAGQGGGLGSSATAIHGEQHRHPQRGTGARQRHPVQRAGGPAGQAGGPLLGRREPPAGVLSAQGQQRPSMVLEVPRPAGLTGKPLVRVEIEEVEFR